MRKGFIKKTVWAGSLALAGALNSAAAHAETLADAMVWAYSHNGIIDQNRALLRVADEDVAIQAAGLKPILTWSGYVRRTFGTTTSSAGVQSSAAGTSANLSLSASLMVYDYGKTRYAIESAKENVLSTRQSLIAAEQTVLLAAVSAYMYVRRDAEVVALRRNNVRVITQELRAAEDRFEVGEVTRTDVALAEARLASARSLLASAQGNLMRSQEQYTAAVGRRPGQLAAPSSIPATAQSLQDAKILAVRTHPTMVGVQHDVAAAELSVKRAEAAMKPTLSLSGTLSNTENFNSPAASATGTIQLGVSNAPIYQGGALSAALRQAMARRDAQRASLHIQRHNVQQEVGFAWAQLQVARASRIASDQQIRAARVAFRGVREEATLGSRTTLDVLNAEQELLDAQANMVSARADEYVAAYTLLSAMGLLTASHLNLDVPHYDPTAYYNQVKDAPAIMSRRGQQLDKVLRAIGKE